MQLTWNRSGARLRKGYPQAGEKEPGLEAGLGVNTLPRLNVKQTSGMALELRQAAQDGIVRLSENSSHKIRRN